MWPFSCICARTRTLRPIAFNVGLIDQSGMRIRMVSKLRKHDAAIMELGLEYSDKMAIPPGVLGFPLSGYCIAECTQTVIYDFAHLHLIFLTFYFSLFVECLTRISTFIMLPTISRCAQALPKSGITVFGSQLHTHLRGLRVLTRHLRDDIELPELNRDDYYSHHYQEIRYLRHQVKVYPVI